MSELQGQCALWYQNEAFHFAAAWSYPMGWTLKAHRRLAGCSWDESPSEIYEGLSSEELGETIAAVAAAWLQL